MATWNDTAVTYRRVFTNSEVFFILMYDNSKIFMILTAARISDLFATSWLLPLIWSIMPECSDVRMVDFTTNSCQVCWTCTLEVILHIN